MTTLRDILDPCCPLYAWRCMRVVNVDGAICDALVASF